MNNSTLDLVSKSNSNTVVSEFVPIKQNRISYQTEEQLETAMLSQLKNLGYEFIDIHSEKALVENLRKQLEKLNDYQFTDNEWNRFYRNTIANSKNGVKEKTEIIQKDYIQLLQTDEGTTKNIRLIDKDNIFNNNLQVLHQYKEDRGNYKNRYDVTILVNGLPLVHIELKRRGVDIREAFNQIDRYQRDSFWAGSGLFEYVQIFVISNGTFTKYYSNTTRQEHINNQNKRISVKKKGNSFEFTSYWTDSKNKKIADLVDFTNYFLSKRTLLNVLTKYCVLTTEDQLLVMRPYQIAATEKIIDKIRYAINNNFREKDNNRGYIWHTTGSGKTLTSFKASQLATELGNNEISKVLFIVDRKDLDSQTIKEYDRFEKGSANGNSSTKVLKQQLEDPNSKIVITTIQKLSRFVQKYKKHPIYDQNVVMIMDECHRSQFGEMHDAITKRFNKYALFGFTGTPIFAVNAGGKAKNLTTEEIFGPNLHTYTIIDAIEDKNVLPFSIDTINTLKTGENIEDKEVEAIEEKEALEADTRIEKIAQYILDNFNIKTKRSSHSSNPGGRFNSIFAVSSNPMAQVYYKTFKRLQKDKKDKLKIATIFSYNPNEKESDQFISDEALDTEKLDKVSRDFLESAIADYNEIFKTNFDTGSQNFQAYYEDVSRRVKNGDIDILIVDNMFLTGFDSPFLNTLWIDKNVKMHGLIQAFSRTNRILNSVKTFGNIVTFRDLEDEINEALALYGNKDAKSIVLLRPYEDYLNGYKDEKEKYHPGYLELIEQLKEQFSDPHDIGIGEENERNFIGLFNRILRVMNVLSVFEEFEKDKKLTEAEFQDYKSAYLNARNNLIDRSKNQKESILDDLIFETELINTTNYTTDVILELVENFAKTKDEEYRRNLKIDIERAVDSSPNLRSKKELIIEFVEKYNASDDINEKWEAYINEKKDEELENIIVDNKLKPEETKDFMKRAFEDGKFKEFGSEITKVMPPMPRFGKTNRSAIKQKIIESLYNFFQKFSDVIFE